MSVWNTGHYANSPKHEALLDLAALIGLAAVPGLLFNWLVPLPFMPPVICLMSFLMAGAFWWFSRHAANDRGADSASAIDVAGIFAVLWIGSGLSSDPKYLVQLFEVLARAS